MPGSALSAVLPERLISLTVGLITIGSGLALALVTGKPMTVGSMTLGSKQK